MQNIKPINVIFLDIDGVLNSLVSNSEQDEGEDWPLSNIRRHLVEKINHIVETLDSILEIKTKIVISSTWRHKFSLNELREIFKKKGLRSEIIDVTPIFMPRKMSLSTYRGLEIEKWLQKTEEKVEKIVILDDYSDMLDLKNFLIQIDYRTGVSDTDAEEIIAALKGNMHINPVSELDGEFSEPTTVEHYNCYKCKSGQVTRQIWDSNCGGYTDYKYECTACKHSWWVEGPDA